MILTTNYNEQIAVISIEGRLDMATSSQFEEAINNAIKEGYVNIVSNLENCSLVASAGLRIYIVALKKLEQLNGEIVISNMNDKNRSVFVISNFVELFEIFQTESEAESYLKTNINKPKPSKL